MQSEDTSGPSMDISCRSVVSPCICLVVPRRSWRWHSLNARLASFDEVKHLNVIVEITMLQYTLAVVFPYSRSAAMRLLSGKNPSCLIGETEYLTSLLLALSELLGMLSIAKTPRHIKT